MKKYLSVILFLLFVTSNLQAEDDFSLGGSVKSAISKHDLTDAYVLLFDKEGNVKDSIRANMGLRWRGPDQIDTLSNFYFRVPRVDSTYVFDVVCPGFETKTVSYRLEKIGKRESYRDMPTIYLNRVTQLNEVTVSATKVKFYNKGDTLVYDASAFQLAEGSMLDALIAQLPGVELSNDGQIKVNGEYVESLLLDGKPFMDNNNNLMLENIAAYTVKNIQVYEGELKKNKEMGIQQKLLTMDVKLKKEYSIGWTINAQGGYGTSDRYIGKLFAMWFNPQWRVSLLGNMNNLNDNRQPGRNDTWEPEQMPSGRLRVSSFGLNYNYENQDKENSADGYLNVNIRDNKLETRTDRTNFLQGGDTYDKTFGNNHDRSTSLFTSHYVSFKTSKVLRIGLSAGGNYNHSKTSYDNLSGTFNKNQDSISRATLENIYSLGSSELLESVINTASTKSDGWAKNYGIHVMPYFTIKLPKTDDRISIRTQFTYNNDKTELWKDYDINFGPTNLNNEHLRQFFDNTPNHNYRLYGAIGYGCNFSSALYARIEYSFSHTDAVKDSYMYALDRLNDMGLYGTLPSDYLMAFDPLNSYKSRTYNNTHSIDPILQFYKNLSNDVNLSIMLQPTIRFVHRRMRYWRDGNDYFVKTSNVQFNAQSWWNMRFFLSFNKVGEGRAETYRNTLMYSLIVNPQLPDLMDMVDVINDADPLNIYLGNPDLKQQIYMRHHFRWNYSPLSHSLDNTLYFNYSTTKNTLTRGYTYDTSTGIRVNRMYNINGDHSYSFTDDLKWQFGTKKQFTLSSYAEITWQKMGDMIGIDMEEPGLSTVHNRVISENFKINWQIGKVNLGLRCDLSNRHTTSTQEGFSTLNATHVNSGFTGLFNLPAGFSINTDFMCYTRRGYGVESLDTTDPVWNIRFSYAPPKNKHWVFMIDGYDMLHTLSNVSYAVNAAGRTVSYTNVLPRYFLFTVQYRLNLQPKKR